MFEDAARDGEPTSGWGTVATYDGAPAVIDALLRLDSEELYTKTELSEAAGVALKTLYLDGTLDYLATLGLLEKEESEGEETRFAVAADTDIYRASAAFDAAVEERLATKSE
ncbi:hypothetical protein [Haloarcula nitratireducens]|uniref:HTH iclR-type domain-containing protein n=1 Tax=Haloarcula nitratireducens TaxID=2487749 RepID=A0AAW4P9W4_9EURY|nr:hypothetical protein [Halomicroarcula nitratireducens]MBX0294684.1 hypothetical protein [Halomicroarcula nitratireducens]